VGAVAEAFGRKLGGNPSARVWAEPPVLWPVHEVAGAWRSAGGAGRSAGGGGRCMGGVAGAWRSKPFSKGLEGNPSARV
jgi:hypothetical protein